MSLFREMYAIIGKRNITVPGVDKADTKSLGEGMTVHSKDVRIVNELPAGYPLAQRYGRRRD